jgi:hypothetical protein
MPGCVCGHQADDRAAPLFSGISMGECHRGLFRHGIAKHILIVSRPREWFAQHRV